MERTPCSTGGRSYSLVQDQFLGPHTNRLNGSLVLLLLAALVSSTASRSTATEPLHVRIDGLIEQQADGPVAAPATDAEFLRRISLDISGRIPTSAEVRAFLEDESATKRQELIDRLLSGPDYPRRMTEMFDVLLMERRGSDPEWETFLRRAFEMNLPWDEMAMAILAPDAHRIEMSSQRRGKSQPSPEGLQNADAGEEHHRGAAFFYTKRLEKYGQNPTDWPGLTRDVGRLFLGIDLQCAQCHDHLTIFDYEQHDFQGLFAVYQNLHIDSKSKFPAVVEKPMTEKLEFVSVFEGVKRATGPRMPFGREFDVPDADDIQAGHSPLALLAEEICRPDNTLFARNIANRLWFVMMGRGLVAPLDEHHDGNPPSHPELLDMLAREFVAQGCDIKWLLRELALTKTYQRSSVLPEAEVVPPPNQFLVAFERPLSAEQLMRSTRQAIGEPDRLAEPDAWQELEEVFGSTFGNPPQEPETEFNPTVKGALFLLNDERFLILLEPRPGNLADRLHDIADPGALIDELFLSVLGRFPSEDERPDLVGALASDPEQKMDSVRHLIWALLTSTEFCVNH